MALDKNGKELPKGITLRADGRYMGRFTFKGESHTLYDKDLKTLKKKMADLKYEVEHGVFAKEENITVEGWFNVWMKEYKENSVKQGTYLRYQNAFKNQIRPTLGKKKLKDVRGEHIQKLYNDMVAAGLSRATIELTNVVLTGMYQQAFKNNIVQKNPVKMATLPRQKKAAERRVLSLQEQKTYLAYAVDSKFYPLYQVALFTGMWSGELRALQWSDVDFKKGIISVNGTLKYFTAIGYMKDTPKTEKSRREIPMLEGVAEILRKHKIEQKKLRLFMGCEWKPDEVLSDLVFTMETGQPILDSSLTRDIGRIIQSINNDLGKNVSSEAHKLNKFEHFTPHALRHTFATRGIENGIPPKVMQEILGHSSITMTLDLYTHVLPDTKSNEMKKIAYLL